jgi:glycerate kinase
VRVLIAPAAFTGSLSAAQAAQAIATGWTSCAAQDVVTTCPLSDGGEGVVDAVLAARGGELVPVTVSGPWGHPVPATVLHLPATDDDPAPTAWVEAGQACGPQLGRPGADPAAGTSAGVGELLLAAVAGGARRVVVAVGDTCCHDGGAGVLAALGAGRDAVLRRGAHGLAGLADDALARLPAARERLSGVQVVLASSSDLPLLGFHGASATDAVRRGATPEQAQELERVLGRYAEVAQRSLVAGRPLGGTGLAGTAGAGAGGGIGFALLLLGGTRVDVVTAVAQAADLTARVAGADLVLTGEARFGWSSLSGGVVATVAATALERGVPTLVLAHEVEVGRREALTLGVSGVYPVIERAVRAGDVRADPAGLLSARAARVARTWSR